MCLTRLLKYSTGSISSVFESSGLDASALIFFSSLVLARRSAFCCRLSSLNGGYFLLGFLESSDLGGCGSGAGSEVAGSEGLPPSIYGRVGFS